MAHRHGGAIGLLSPISVTARSSGSVFRGNKAETGDGGAVYVVHNGVVERSWNSTAGDRYERNAATEGSGGAFAALGAKIYLMDGASCANNSAPRGGGGCIFWDPLADLADSAKWASFGPYIEPMELDKQVVSSGNTAAMGMRRPQLHLWIPLTESGCPCPGNIISPSSSA